MSRNLSFLIITLSTALLPHLAHSRVISDSLVKNLDCSRLQVSNVLSSLRPSAFSELNHFPIQNWGANLLGQCWALSSAQRRFFYFLRTGEARAQITRKGLEKALNMVGAHVPSECPQNVELNGQYCDRPSFKNIVVPIREASLGSSSLFFKMQDGLGGSATRSFEREIEGLQQRKFYNLGNVGFLTTPVALSSSQNYKTLNHLTKSLKQGRLPLVVVRGSTASQHVVVVKSFTQHAKDHFSFQVYDSNSPYSDAKMEFILGNFDAQEIIGRFDPANADRPAGVLVTDEADMDQIQRDLFDYYSAQCKRGF